jgi:transposase
MALRAGVNANLLRRWICEHQKEHRDTSVTPVSENAAAFVPVVESAGAKAQPQLPRLAPPHREAPPVAQRPAAPVTDRRNDAGDDRRNGASLKVK